MYTGLLKLSGKNEQSIRKRALKEAFQWKGSMGGKEAYEKALKITHSCPDSDLKPASNHAGKWVKGTWNHLALSS